MGKTSLAKALAASIHCSWKRIQFTPDLLPADLVGVSIYQRSTETFQFEPGPLFANIVLADEINRASPKTQSALLEAMEERQITADGRSRLLEPPFMVIATQNPIDQEGTYRLPESQLDRFLLRIAIGYPDRAAEMEMLDAQGSAEALRGLEPVVSTEEVLAMIAAVRQVHVAKALKSYLIDLAETSRRHPSIELGLSPRATLQLAAASRAHAAARVVATRRPTMSKRSPRPRSVIASWSGPTTAPSSRPPTRSARCSTPLRSRCPDEGGPMKVPHSRC